MPLLYKQLLDQKPKGNWHHSKQKLEEVEIAFI